MFLTTLAEVCPRGRGRTSAADMPNPLWQRQDAPLPPRAAAPAPQEGQPHKGRVLLSVRTTTTLRAALSAAIPHLRHHAAALTAVHRAPRVAAAPTAQAAHRHVPAAVSAVQVAAHRSAAAAAAAHHHAEEDK